jgi:hypothetical protein
MHKPEEQTLQAIFAHPLRQGVRCQDVEVLLKALGGNALLEGRRLKIELPIAGQTWIQLENHSQHKELEKESTMQLRRFLEKAGVNPSNTTKVQEGIRGDQSNRLVLHLSHRSTDAYLLSGKEVKHAVLKAHGLWGKDQNLSHRHERDIAGQKAPTEYAYLQQLSSAIETADAVILVGHGHGESDMRQHLLHYLENHHPHLMKKIVDVTTADGSSLHEGELLALARRQFGNLPDRHLPTQHQ